MNQINKEWGELFLQLIIFLLISTARFYEQKEMN
jgi:hypothetical protein